MSLAQRNDARASLMFVHVVVQYGLALVSYASGWRSWYSPSVSERVQHSAKHVSNEHHVRYHVNARGEGTLALATLFLRQGILSRRLRFHRREGQPLRMAVRFEKQGDFGPLVVEEPFMDHHDKISKHMPGSLIFLHGKFGNGDEMAKQLQPLLGGLTVQGFYPTAQNSSKGPSWKKQVDKNNSLPRLSGFDGIDFDFESIAYIHDLIDKQIAAGDLAENIVIGGFSQGGSVALRAALSYPARLGGCVVSSTFLGNIGSLKIELANAQLKVLVLHGIPDDRVPSNNAQKLVSVLQANGLDVEFHVFSSLNHSLPSKDSPAAIYFRNFLEARFQQSLASLVGSQRLIDELFRKRIDSIGYGYRYGDRDFDNATSLTNLARLLEVLGHSDNAEPLFLKALDIYKRRLGAKHPSSATALNDLAGVYSELGAKPLGPEGTKYLLKRSANLTRLDECHRVAAYLSPAMRLSYAESLHLELVAATREQLGEEHPSHITSLKNLGRLYCKMGKKEAEPKYLDAVAIEKRSVGENHPRYASSLENLAWLYYERCKYEKTELLLLEVVDIKKKHLGEEHASYGTSLANLAGLYCLMGRHEKAKSLYWEAVGILKNTLGEKDPRYLASLRNLAGLYLSMGSYWKAAILYKISQSDPQDVLTVFYRFMGSYDKTPYLVLQHEVLHRMLQTYLADPLSCGLLWDVVAEGGVTVFTERIVTEADLIAQEEGIKAALSLLYRRTIEWTAEGRVVFDFGTLLAD